MTIQMAIDVISATLLLSLTILAPLVGVGIAVGLTVSILQSITSIQEQSLTFIPKLVAVSFTLMFLGNWILVKLTDYASSNFSAIRTVSPSQR